MFDKESCACCRDQPGSRRMTCCNNEIYRTRREAQNHSDILWKEVCGAAREMRESTEAWNQPPHIEQSLAQKQIKWKFNPQVLRSLEVSGSEWSEAGRKQ